MRPARSVFWGKLPITRSAIPEGLADISGWPSVDPTAIPEERQAQFDQNVEAVRLFVEEPEVTIAEIKRRTRVHPEQLYRLLNRCMAIDSNGRIYGFRGAIPRIQLKTYTRAAPVRQCKPRSKGGAAGAFKWLLGRFPAIEKWLRRQAILRNKPLRDGEVRKVRELLRGVHKKFLEKLREAGVTESEYPFNRDLLAIRSLTSYMNRIASGDSDAEGSENANSLPSDITGDGTNQNDSQLPRFLLPFDGIQFDGHKFDARFTIRMIDPLGMETLLEITRIWILVALDVVTRAVLGHQVVLATEYDSDEVAVSFQSCFGESNRPQFTIPGLSVRVGGGFPCDLFEEARYPGWRWLQYDSAKANISTAVLERANNIVGCYIHTGRLGEPDDRSCVERFLAYLAKYGFHQVPGTTGSKPDDPVKKLGDVGNDLTRLMTVDELDQVVYVMLADYNAESHPALGSRTPNEAMRYWLTKPGVQIRQIPRHKRTQLQFLQEARVIRVVGGGKKSTKPHINFAGVRYTSDILKKKPYLVGKELRIYFNIKDIRQVRAFYEDGSELGFLIAEKSWRQTPHSLRVRKEILRLVRLGKLRYRDGDDAIEAWANYKRRQAPKDKRAATALGRQQRDAKAFRNRNEQAQSTNSDSQISKSDRHSESQNLADDRHDGTADSPAEPQPLKIRKVVVFRR